MAHLWDYDVDAGMGHACLYPCAKPSCVLTSKIQPPWAMLHKLALYARIQCLMRGFTLVEANCPLVETSTSKVGV